MKTKESTELKALSDFSEGVLVGQEMQKEIFLKRIEEITDLFEKGDSDSIAALDRSDPLVEFMLFVLVVSYRDGYLDGSQRIEDDNE